MFPPGLRVPAGVADPDVTSGSRGLMMMEVWGLPWGDAGWIASREAEGSGTPRLEADSCLESTPWRLEPGCVGRGTVETAISELGDTIPWLGDTIPASDSL